MSYAALATRLPRLDPQYAALQTLLLAAIDGTTAGNLVLRAKPAAPDNAPAIRFATPSGEVEMVPLLVDGTVPMLLGDDDRPDAVAALATLAGLEPLIAAVERCLGVAFRPSGVGRSAHPLRQHVEAYDAAGIVDHAVTLGFAADATFTPQPPPPRFTAATGRLITGFGFTAPGPILTRRRIEALGVGDLLLVGGRTLAGSIGSGGRRWFAQLTPAAATVTITQGTDRMSDVEDRSPDLDPDLRLALSLRIDGGSVSLAELTRLAPGSVLPLGIPGGAMPVTLEIGGAAVATGELVAVGEAYGVLITGRIGFGG